MGKGTVSQDRGPLLSNSRFLLPRSVYPPPASPLSNRQACLLRGPGIRHSPEGPCPISSRSHFLHWKAISALGSTLSSYSSLLHPSLALSPHRPPTAAPSLTHPPGPALTLEGSANSLGASPQMMSNSASWGPQNTHTLCPEEGTCGGLPKPSFSFSLPRKSAHRPLGRRKRAGRQAEAQEESKDQGGRKTGQLGLRALTLLGKVPSISRR